MKTESILNIKKCKFYGIRAKGCNRIRFYSSGQKKISNIQNETKISPEELNLILEELENRKFIRVEELKGWFGKKIELKITEDGSNELDRKIIEIQDKWKEMQSIYESGDKQKLQQKMEENKSFLPTMMFFGVMDMMMFSMMFSMMGIGMSDYVSQEICLMRIWVMKDMILTLDSRVYLILELKIEDK